MYIYNILSLTHYQPAIYIPLLTDNIVTNFPNLKYLSMMKNEAAPSYFNGGSKKDYQDYRYDMFICCFVCLLVCFIFFFFYIWGSGTLQCNHL